MSVGILGVKPDPVVVHVHPLVERAGREQRRGERAHERRTDRQRRQRQRRCRERDAHLLGQLGALSPSSRRRPTVGRRNGHRGPAFVSAGARELRRTRALRRACSSTKGGAGATYDALSHRTSRESAAVTGAGCCNPRASGRAPPRSRRSSHSSRAGVSGRRAETLARRANEESAIDCPVRSHGTLSVMRVCLMRVRQRVVR